MPASRDIPHPTRRQVLAAASAGVAGASTGCLGRLRSIFGWQASGNVALTIHTLPEDTDPYALRIARQVQQWLEKAGINSQISPVDAKELRQAVLLQHNFDMFVGRLPNAERTPDELHPLLHSTGLPSPGWQNPFGYANFRVDDLLERQRQVTGTDRFEAVADMQRSIARTQPFTIVGFPTDIRTARSDRYVNWADADLTSPLGFLRLERAEVADVEEPGTLRVATTTDRTVGNLNPLAVTFRDRGPITDLLYDSLGRAYGGEGIQPWLAESWQFSDEDGSPRAVVQMREDLTWHDGRLMTTDDVRFTYEFLQDTSPEDNGSAVPVPRYQGPISVLENVRIMDGKRLEFTFTECTRQIAKRALRVPILPAHIWRERRQPATVGGVRVSDLVTEALITDNTPAVGSGPLRFEGNPSNRLILERFEDHLLHRGDDVNMPSWIEDGIAFDRLVVRVAVSELTAAGSVADGSVDGVISPLGARALGRIDEDDTLQKLSEMSKSFYFIGYNARRPPLTNPRFRNLLGRLVDQEHLIETVFEDEATPGASPLTGSDWLPTDLEWEDGDPETPFLGSDGELDVERAQTELKKAGYLYDNGKVVRR